MPVLTPEQKEQYLETGEYKTKIDKENFFKFRKMTSKDYGRIFWSGVIIASLGSLIPHGFVLGLLINLIGSLGLIAGIFWVAERFRSDKKNK